MKRNLKALGLSLVAVFALSAMAASAAQAAKNTHHFTVPNGPAIITGHDETGAAKPVFKITTNGTTHSIECEVGTYEGTAKEATDKEVTVRPTYEKCTNELGGTATVDVNHCAFILEGTTNASGDAGLEIECAPGNQIEITYKVFGVQCIVDIGPQTVTGVHYTQTENASTKKLDITVNATVTGISYRETGNFPCPSSETRTDASFTGGITAEAYKHEKCSPLSSSTEVTPNTTTPGNYFNECEGDVQNLELNENVTEP